MTVFFPIAIPSESFSFFFVTAFWFNQKPIFYSQLCWLPLYINGSVPFFFHSPLMGGATVHSPIVVFHFFPIAGWPLNTS